MHNLETHLEYFPTWPKNQTKEEEHFERQIHWPLIYTQLSVY